MCPGAVWHWRLARLNSSQTRQHVLGAGQPECCCHGLRRSSSCWCWQVAVSKYQAAAGVHSVGKLGISAASVHARILLSKYNGSSKKQSLYYLLGVTCPRSVSISARAAAYSSHSCFPQSESLRFIFSLVRITPSRSKTSKPRSFASLLPHLEAVILTFSKWLADMPVCHCSFFIATSPCTILLFLLLFFHGATAHHGPLEHARANSKSWADYITSCAGFSARCSDWNLRSNLPDKGMCLCVDHGDS